MIAINRQLLTPNKYSRPQTPLKTVKGIALHYVGNPNTSAMANRNYFESLRNQTVTYASSHYIVGLNGEIIQCVPEEEIAYCTGNRNADTISIENCHPNASGKFNNTTCDSLTELCADICVRYKLNPLTDVIRHYDATGKKCPLYYVNNSLEWIKLKLYIKAKMDSLSQKPDDIESLISKMKSVISMDGDYWAKVLRGKETANPAWLKLIFERLIDS